MKRIDAIIKEQFLDTVRMRLTEIGVEEYTVTEVKDFGAEKTREVYRGVAYEVSSRPKFFLTIIAAEYQVTEILDAIVEGARQGGVGDGTILVTTIEEMIRIRTTDIERVAC